MVYEVSL